MVPEQQAARRALHEEEVRARLGWCLERGLTPAAEHVHSSAEHVQKEKNCVVMSIHWHCLPHSG